MKTRNDLNFQSAEEVGAWYDTKFREMGGSWHVPDSELDEMLDLLGATYASAHMGEDGWETNLLELGCGDGKLMARAFSRGLNVFGVDVSWEALDLSNETMERAEKTYWLLHTDEDNPVCWLPSWSVYQKPMENLDTFPKSWFDFVISYGSLEHSLDIPAACREMARVLKPGGRYLNYAPNELWVHTDQPLETTATAEEWTRMLTDAGLTVDQVIQRGDNTIYIGRKP